MALQIMIRLKNILNGNKSLNDLANGTAKLAAAAAFPPLAPITNAIIDTIDARTTEQPQAMEPVPSPELEQETEISALEEHKRWKKLPFYSFAMMKGEAVPTGQNDKQDLIDDYLSQFYDLGTRVLKEYRLQVVKLKNELSKADSQSFSEGDIKSRIEEVNLEISFWEIDLKKDHIADKSAQFSKVYQQLHQGFNDGKKNYTSKQILKSKR